jgi:hypothetical protein
VYLNKVNLFCRAAACVGSCGLLCCRVFESVEWTVVTGQCTVAVHVI